MKTCVANSIPKPTRRTWYRQKVLFRPIILCAASGFQGRSADRSV